MVEEEECLLGVESVDTEDLLIFFGVTGFMTMSSSWSTSPLVEFSFSLPEPVSTTVALDKLGLLERTGSDRASERGSAGGVSS